MVCMRRRKCAIWLASQRALIVFNVSWFFVTVFQLIDNCVRVICVLGHCLRRHFFITVISMNLNVSLNVNVGSFFVVLCACCCFIFSIVICRRWLLIASTRRKCQRNRNSQMNAVHSTCAFARSRFFFQTCFRYNV